VGAEPPPSGTSDLGGGRSVTVLVADDNEVARRLCRRVLEKAGYNVLTASDGQEAVSLALANSPDMILLDVAMPGMDGLEAMRQIKAQRPGIPIVIASAHLLPSDRERFLAAGADEMLIPPLRLSDLLAVVAKLTGNRGQQMKQFHSQNASIRQAVPNPESGQPLPNRTELPKQENLGVIEPVAVMDAINASFDGFVQASITAIEQRDPTTAGHGFRVEKLTTGLAHAVNEITEGKYRDVRLTEDEFKELRYACLLHDIGPAAYLHKGEEAASWSARSDPVTVRGH
jgi:CheY-like chemotaxis protein